MAAPMNLNTAKKNLSDALGDGMKSYLTILKAWFKQKISREDFDHEARKMLPTELGCGRIHLHNEFLLAILTKCQIFGPSLVPKKLSSPPLLTEKLSTSTQLVKKKVSTRKPNESKSNFQNRFIPANALSKVAQILPRMPDPDERGPSYASRDMIIPDVAMVHGRMIVSAWDFGLEDVQDDAVRLLMNSVETQLKNILTVIFARRNAYRLREGRSKFGMGTQTIGATLRNRNLANNDQEKSEMTSLSSRGVHMPSIKPSVETGMRDSSVQLSASPQPPTKEIISLYDLFDALQTHKSVIPAHTVYSVNMERIINKIWHPSNEELKQEYIHKQEISLKREAYSQQAVIRT